MKTEFFMSIFNQILHINNTEIMLIFDKNINIWFGLRDIIIVLGYKNYEKAITNINISKNNKTTFNKLEISLEISKKYKGIKPHKLFINESGLYEILSSSKKPLAMIFMNKYFTEIMPQIRKTGKYILEGNDKKEYDNMTKELNIHKKNNKILLNNQRNIKYPIGNALYIFYKNKDNNKYYKLGFTKNLNSRLSTYNTGLLNKILYDYYIIVDNKTIDICTKKLLKNSQYIKNKEYYNISLTKIINFIKSCDSNINTICCGYCNKCFIYNKIPTHNCKYKLN